MDLSEKPTIIVKRIKKVAGGHHGGAWKIAYADFVTAMMAFFLLMWLLGSTTKGDLQGIAEYFRTPLKVALQGGSGSGDSSSVIRGGGQDLTRTEGQMRRGEIAAQPARVDIKAAEAERARVEKEYLKGVQQKIEALIAGNPTLAAFKNQLLIDMTSQGLRIQIVDEQNRPMFDSGRADLKPYSKEILHELAGTLNGVDNHISLSGHTDAQPYAFGEKGYSNWELSAERANASRRELVAGGMDEKKILRVEGLSSAVPFDAKDPLDAANRRISILVLNKVTEAAILNDGKSVTDSSDAPVSSQSLAAAAPGTVAATPSAEAAAPGTTAPAATDPAAPAPATITTSNTPPPGFAKP